MFNFSKIVLDHFYHPRNVGELANVKNIHKASVSTPDKTTVMQLHVQVCDERIRDAKFKTLGCPACIAVMSLITEKIIGQPVALLSALSSEALIKELKLSREKYYCALLGEDLLTQLIHP